MLRGTSSGANPGGVGNMLDHVFGIPQDRLAVGVQEDRADGKPVVPEDRVLAPRPREERIGVAAVLRIERIEGERLFGDGPHAFRLPGAAPRVTTSGGDVYGWSFQRVGQRACAR